MKKNIKIALLAIAPLMLAACNSFGEEVVDDSSFLVVADNSVSNFNVTRAYSVFKKSDNAKDLSEGVVGRDMSIYAGNNYSFDNGDGGATSKRQGVKIEKNGSTFFFLVTGKDGIVSDTSNTWEKYHSETLDAINEDYSSVKTTYESLKEFSGKESGQVGSTSYSSIYFAHSVVGKTAGYTLKTVSQVEGGTRTIDLYFTLDQVSENWGISYFSRRVTDDIGGEKIYYVTEYTFSCMDDEMLSKKVLGTNSFSSVNFKVEGETFLPEYIVDGLTFNKK